MLVAIIEYELRPGVEAEFQEALAEMLAKVKEVDGFLGEEPCRSVLNEFETRDHFVLARRSSAKCVAKASRPYTGQAARSHQAPRLVPHSRGADRT